jgi:hypothetical protein
MIFARETFLEAKEARGGAITVGTSVFGTADIAVVFVDSCDVRAAAFGACEESFGSFTVWDRMSQAEASSAL